MITTVTLNVAVDKLYLVDEFETSRVTRVRECTPTAGGKGLNVARVASILGENVFATGFIGGHSGRYVEEMLKSDRIENDFVRVDGETRTCINVIDRNGRSTELLEPGVTVNEENRSEFLTKFAQIIKKSSVIVLSGSMPRGCGPEFYPELIRLAKKDGCKVILDTSGENLKQGIKAQPTMIKPNRDEIGALLGTDAVGRDELVRAAQTLHDGGIAYVAVSLGKEGALLVCGEGVFIGTPPDVKVVNTVGCGDSMVAAFAAGFERGYGPEQALKFALAVSSANAMCRQTGFFRPEDLSNILSGGKVTKLA